ncbi:ABC transporter ATP-binding protein [Lactonifactor longoviformis]|uniref:ABC transporter ATP-binding protein n=1 Tax=Lactonifactor longoviformis TaxID=341220 RepID=UPI0036F33A6B
MKNIAVEIKNVRKVYKLFDKPTDRLRESLSFTHKNYHRDHFALEDISLTVHEGECVGIIGTNGSGKSTLLKIVTGVLNPTEGSVTVNGKISALLELGAGFNMEYTGIENIYLNGTMMGFSEAEMDKKIDDIIDFAEIGDFIQQPVKTYSSGMFARLAFAVAINVEPDILIVDEALSVGDIFFQAKCYRKFNEFKEKGKTIVFVSHDLNSVLKYCDRSLLIHHGKQIAVGKSSEVIDIYKKILANQYDENGPVEPSQELSAAENKPVEIWKEKLVTNPQVVDYGEKKAEIVDFAIVDEKGMITSTIDKGSRCKIKMKVFFHDTVQNPIFAITIKDRKGTEITGTNTALEDNNLSTGQKGTTATAVFEQRIDLQGGQYLISFGCTGYELDSLVVYNRLYDACFLEVFSAKNTIGYYDMNSSVTYEK